MIHNRALLGLFAAFVTFLLCVAAAGQKTATSSNAGGKASYKELLAKLKAGDTSIDYTALRISFSEMKDADADADPDLRKAMFAAYNTKKVQEAIDAADKILDQAYVNIEAHGLESMAYRSLGNIAKADFHKEIFQGLVNSIVVGKDGKTPETAFVVISTQEEYVVMRALGYTVGSQALVSQGPHRFDILSGTDQKTNQPVKIYFNIDIPWAAETRMFSHK